MKQAPLAPAESSLREIRDVPQNPSSIVDIAAESMFYPGTIRVENPIRSILVIIVIAVIVGLIGRIMRLVALIVPELSINAVGGEQLRVRTALDRLAA
jgi:hypothetical protein